MKNYRLLALIGFFFAAVAVAQTTGLMSAQADSAVVRVQPISAQAVPAVVRVQPTSTGPRTPDGHPDFQGIWNNGTLTPLERGIVAGTDGKPISLPPVATLTIPDSEAKAYEQRLRTADDFKRGDGSGADLSGEVNAEFTDPPEGLGQFHR